MKSEFCANGSLKNHLKMYNTSTPMNLVKKWLLGSAKGLQHLHSHSKILFCYVMTFKILFIETLQQEIFFWLKTCPQKFLILEWREFFKTAKRNTKHNQVLDLSSGWLPNLSHQRSTALNQILGVLVATVLLGNK